MPLSIGRKAPDFTTTDQDGNPVTLSDFAGKKVVLYFYPKDMTPGCTAEACDLRDNYKMLQKQGYEVFGISTDSEKLHKKFIAKEKLPFRLLADTDRSVHEKYGTWAEKSMYGRKYMGTLRVTYIIEDGIIKDVIEKVNTKNHTAQILDKESTQQLELNLFSPSAAKGKKVAAKKVVKKGKKVVAKKTATKKVVNKKKVAKKKK